MTAETGYYTTKAHESFRMPLFNRKVTQETGGTKNNLKMGGGDLVTIFI